MTRDELEFSISQYLDGTLPKHERAALEVRVAEDPEAQALLTQEESLTAVLRSGPPLPNLQWDRLTQSISEAIDEQLEERMAKASWWMRARVPAGLVAIAACLLIAFGIAFHNRPAGVPIVVVVNHTGQQGQPGPAPVIMVEGPSVDRPEGVVVSEISVAAGGSYAKDASLSPYADEIDNRPARVVIASGINPNQPRAVFPY